MSLAKKTSILKRVELLVQKYGGTSVATAEQILDVARHIVETKNAGNQVVVVVSAMGAETDELLALANQVSSNGNTPPNNLPNNLLSKSASKQVRAELDMLITSGERKAAALLCLAIENLGASATSLTGKDAGLTTDAIHQSARIENIAPDRLKKLLNEGCIPVVAGSQGVSSENKDTFLGRGGSDTTAVALAHALSASECELYTDVSGIFTADPRIVANAQKIDSITYDELLDMTATGCPKPAMRAVEVARNFNVALHVRSAFSWEQGTKINKRAMEQQAVVSAVTHDRSEAKITIAQVPDTPGVAAGLFRSLADKDIHVDMIVQNVASSGTTDISFTLPMEELDIALTTTQEFSESKGGGTVDADQNICRVSLVGAGMKTHPGVAATVFETLADAGINIEMISTSSIRISCVIAEDKLEDAVNALHSAFELEKE